jgi:hypothetical protein
MPPSSNVAGPLLELRSIGISSKYVQHHVWSFNIRALPSTNAILKETLDRIHLDKAHLDKILPDNAVHYRQLLVRLEAQLAVLNEWHGSPAWRQLDEGGATWSDMPHLPGEDCGLKWVRGTNPVDKTIEVFEGDVLKYVHWVPTDASFCNAF